MPSSAPSSSCENSGVVDNTKQRMKGKRFKDDLSMQDTAEGIFPCVLDSCARSLCACQECLTLGHAGQTRPLGHEHQGSDIHHKPQEARV